jgi:NADPH:quinone reductase-like Zn-dependent oxidoreductase
MEPETPMKALLLSKYRQLEMADVPTPAAGSGEVLIRAVT